MHRPSEPCQLLKHTGKQEDIDELSVSHSARALASAKFCQKWADDYVYKGLDSFVKVKKLF